MEDWSAKGNDKIAESKQKNISANCFMDGNTDKFFKALSSDTGKQSNQSLGLPDLQFENALNYKPAEKGSRTYAQWQEKAQERSSAALDPNCKNETSVQKGDSLWGIAERSMKERGGDFSKKDVLAEMNKIIAANKDQYPWIEKNPNFLKEGMQLRLPEAQTNSQEMNKGRSSSTAVEELGNLNKSSKEGGLEPNAHSSSNAVEELGRLRSTDSKSVDPVHRSSSNAVEELSSLLKKSSEDDGKQWRGTASSTSVEERQRNSTETNSGENYNLSNYEDLETTKSKTITSARPESSARLSFDAEGNSITTRDTRAKTFRR